MTPVEETLRKALEQIVGGNPTCETPEAQCEYNAVVAKAALDATKNVAELDRIAFTSLCNAAEQSKWMPPEYCMNDWLADCRDFLIDGRR